MSVKEEVRTTIEKCIEQGHTEPLAKLIFKDTEDYDINDKLFIVKVMIEIGNLLVTETFEINGEEKKTTSNISTANHEIAAAIMIICGGMLESGAPCSKQLAPQFLQRIKVAMQQAIESQGENIDAVKSLKMMYLPIVAAFSVSKQVRKQRAPQDVRDVLAKAIDENIERDLQWLLRMFNIKEDEELVIIDITTKVGCICALSGISVAAQLQAMLNIYFPRSKEDPLLDKSSIDGDYKKAGKRHPREYTWCMWNGFAGDTLDPTTLEFIRQPDTIQAFVSQEASIDEIPYVTLIPRKRMNDDNQQEDQMTIENFEEKNDTSRSDIHTSQWQQQHSRHRLLIFAPPLYQRTIDPRGVFHTMRPDIDIVKRLSDEEVTHWLESCIEFAATSCIDDNEKEKVPFTPSTYRLSGSWSESDTDSCTESNATNGSE